MRRRGLNQRERPAACCGQVYDQERCSQYAIAHQKMFLEFFFLEGLARGGERSKFMQFYYNSGIPQRQRRTRDGRPNLVNRCAPACARCQ